MKIEKTIKIKNNNNKKNKIIYSDINKKKFFFLNLFQVINLI
jgi:hypothetical protein